MSFTGELLPYQHEAVDLMCERGKVLVAYDLGLGKTVLTIAAIERLMDSGKIQEPGIVVCLSSLKYQWASQIEKFTNGTSKSIVIDGTPNKRAQQYEQVKDWKNNGIDYVIMNYEQVVSDFGDISKLPRGFIIADEATAVKSFRSKRSKVLKKLKANYKFALTGTPVENGKPEELFSIMEFVDSTVLGRFDVFDAKYIVRNYFGGVQHYRNINELNDVLSKAIIRKRQQDPDVSPYLPETLISAPILVPFDKVTEGIYNEIANELLLDLDEIINVFSGDIDLFGSNYRSDNGPLDELKGKLMPKLIALRMLCDHPLLIKASANLYLSNPLGNEGSKYAAELFEEGRLNRAIKSPKLEVLKEVVVNFLSENPKNKLVIFTSFVNMTSLIATEFSNFGVVTYTGKLNASQKEQAKVTFQTDPGIRILVSSDAGGYGVDLPQANYLINYDLPWNAGLALQRNGRIQRASSEWEHVVIQDIIMKGSIEERQHALLQQKMSVANAIVDGEGLDKDGGLSLTVGSLRQFLQSV